MPTQPDLNTPLPTLNHSHPNSANQLGQHTLQENLSSNTETVHAVTQIQHGNQAGSVFENHLSSYASSWTSSLTLHESYKFCCTVARREARNFYWSFRLLPASKRHAMCVLYAFMRQTDDLADAPLPTHQRQANLEQWKARCNQLLAESDSKLNNPQWTGESALVDIVRRYKIPTHYLTAVIDGMFWDLNQVRIATNAEFDQYCWHVASAVGLCCLHIWGFDSRNGRAEALAEQLGLAFQRTNILRDVAEDYRNNRIYLPAELLASYSINPAELASDHASPNLKQLVHNQSIIARQDYLAADELLTLISPDCRPMLRALTRIYKAILDQIEAQSFDVLTHRASVTKWRKCALMLGSLIS